MRLNNGTSIPSLGISTQYIDDRAKIVYAVMDVGISHLDIGSLSSSQEVLVEALQECFRRGKRRDEIYITSHLTSMNGQIENEVKRKLKLLQLDSFDLLLIQWPTVTTENTLPLHKIW